MDRRILLIVALVAGLTGCAAQPQGSESAQAEPVEVPANVDTQPRARAIYNVLVGELAGQRGDKERAAEAYARATEDTDSAAVAERAARIAVYAGREDLARETAERWQTLAPDSATPRRLRALLALRQGDSEGAYRHLKGMLPDEASAIEEALAEAGAFVASEAANATGVEAVSRLADDYPGERMAHYIVARVAMQAGQAETAAAAAERALEQSEDWRAARLIRVRAQLETGQTEAAIDGLRALVEANPEDYGLRLQLARTLADEGREASALTQFERVIEAQPENGRALYAGALLALDRGDTERARRWLERLLATDQRTDAAQYYLGRLAEQKQDYASARNRYSRTGGSYEHQAQIRLAIMEAAEGEIEAAVERLERLRENNPNMAVQAWQAQGQLLRQAGRVEAAIEAYNKGLEADTGNSDLLYARAMTHVSGDNVEAALRDLRSILDDDPDNAHALNALGYTLAENTERYDEAEELIRRAYAKRPDDPAVIDSMGWIAYKQGRLEEAERYLREAYEMSDQAEIAAHLGEVLWQLGKRDEARQIWEKALDAYQQDDVVRETMERLTP